jgi:1-deoxy-D-xylulose-5-phosphate synthase
MKGPILLHVSTTKGKGYKRAENAPDRYHGVGCYQVDTGKPAEAKTRDTYTDVFGQAMLEQAAANPKVVAVTAAMPDGTGLCPFKRRYPARFFDVGIAESHAVTFAAGLAKGGLRPVVAVYSSFLQRAYDQILHDVCIQRLPVVLAIDHAGVVGSDGETHQGLYDVAYLSHKPHLTVMAPKNKFELCSMLDFALRHDGPVAIRYPKGEASAIAGEYNSPITYGRAETIRQGTAAALVSVGAMMETALSAAALLSAGGLDVSVYNARFIKPLDMSLIERLRKYPYVFTLADCARIGGFGPRLAEACTGPTKPLFYDFAFPDVFVEQGTREELLKRYRLDADHVAETVRRMVAPKKYNKAVTPVDE